MKILIVDDDLSVRKSVQLQLEQLGHEVVTASEGLSALKVLKDRNDIKAVITDYRMPVLGGKEWLDILQHYHPDLNTIVTSAYSFIKEKLGDKMVFLEKPFGPQELEAALEKTAAVR
jgi:DNA-binding NtrC family response regulator